MATAPGPEIEQGLADAGAPVPVTFVRISSRSRAACWRRAAIPTLGEDLDDGATRHDPGRCLPRRAVRARHRRAAGHEVDGRLDHAFVHARRVAERRAVVVAAIDNLGKGAAGQAIQNMNAAFALDEGAGLARFGVHP